MYKSRITGWGLDKKRKANEMKAIARKKIERDTIGKASSFQIRGRQVEVEEVLRHFKRKGYQSLEDVVARDKSPEACTPSDVRFSTPGTLFPLQSTNSAHFGSLLCSSNDRSWERTKKPRWQDRYSRSKL